MSSTILQALLEVSGLAPTDTVTIAHGLRLGTRGVAPNKILPDRGTPIAVQSFDETEVTFVNNGTTDQDAIFLAQYDHSIQQAADAPPVDLVWMGQVAASGGAPDNAPYLTQGSVGGLSNERNIQAITAPLVFISAADTVLPLAARRFSAGQTANIFEVQNQAGVALADFTAAGALELPGAGTTMFVSLGGGSAAAVSAVNTGRVRYNEVTDVLQTSVNGGAWTDFPTAGAPIDAPYLTQGSVGGLSNERNIEVITATLAFISSADGIVPLAAQRFSAGATADIFQTRDQTGTAILRFLASGDLQWTNGGGVDRVISTADAPAGAASDAIIIRSGNGFTDPVGPTSANDISVITGNGGNGGATPATGGGNFNIITGHGFGDASEGGNINLVPDTLSTTPGGVNIATAIGENAIAIGNTNALIGLYGVTPRPQGSPVSSPAGGAVVDAEARASIDELISRLNTTVGIGAFQG